jgi:hypothetical protein
MERIIGVRPSFARERLGWEWVLEAWLLREWESGGLIQSLRGLSHEGPKKKEERSAAAPDTMVDGTPAPTVDKGAELSEAERNGAAA